MIQRNYFRALLVLAAILLFAGCINFNQEKKELLTSSQLNVSSSEQVVSSGNNSVTVRIPGGFVESSQTLSITSVKNPPTTFFPGMKSLGAYEITLGDGKTDSFSKNAILEFPYDPATIPAGVKPIDAFTVAYLNRDTKTWVEAPISVDEINHKVIVKANHFSIWDLFGLLTDYESVPTPQGHFTVYYDKKFSFKCLGTDFGGERLCAEGVGKVAEQARAVYIEKNYIVPEKVNIYISDVEESEVARYTGNILLSKYFETLSNKATVEQGKSADNRVKHEVAHELFHVIQNQYINVYSMGFRHWFMEASADYAADKIAMHDGTMGMDIKPDCLKDSLYATSNQYNDAHFINYLMEKDNLYFPEMFDYINEHTATDAQETLLLLKKYVDTEGPKYRVLAAGTNPSPFEQAYYGFAAYYYFNPASPIKIQTDLLTDTRSPLITFKTNDETKTAEIPSMLPYTVQLIAIKADKGDEPLRTITVNPEQDTGTGLILAGYKATNNDPHTATLAGTTSTKSEKITADLGKDDTLYILAINTRNPAGGTSQAFKIDITAAKDKKKKTTAFDVSKTGDLNQNTLTIKGSGTITGPAEMVVVLDQKPNILYITAANAKNHNTSITFAANLNYQPQKTHWEVLSQSSCPKVTKDISNFKYKITTSEPQPVNPNPPKGYRPPLPKKDETLQTNGNINIQIPPEALTNGEYRIDIDLVWDWTDNWECSEDSPNKSGPQSAKGGPGTNIIHVAIQ